MFPDIMGVMTMLFAIIFHYERDLFQRLSLRNSRTIFHNLDNYTTSQGYETIRSSIKLYSLISMKRVLIYKTNLSWTDI